MENTYGIGVTNRFELFLDDESDPLETLKLKEQEKEQKKKNKVAEKENKGKTEPQQKAKTGQAPKKVIKETPVHNKPQENRRDGEYFVALDGHSLAFFFWRTCDEVSENGNREITECAVSSLLHIPQCKIVLCCRS